MEGPTQRPWGLLFDIDSTLLATGGASTRSWAWSFERLHGIPVEVERFAGPGMTDPQIARVLHTGVLGRPPTRQETAALMAGYLERLPYEVEHAAGFRVMPGVTTLLPAFGPAGVLVGVVTGLLEAAAHIKLARAGLDRYFPFGGYGSDAEERADLTRRAIERAETIHGAPLPRERLYVIGDTPRDIAAGRAVGAVAVGVATGHYTVTELRAAGADHALENLEHGLPGLPLPLPVLTPSAGGRA